MEVEINNVTGQPMAVPHVTPHVTPQVATAPMHPTAMAQGDYLQNPAPQQILTFEDLDNLLVNLDKSINSSMSIRAAQERFNRTVNQLKTKEDKLRSVVSTMQATKNTLQNELKSKEEEERALHAHLDNLHNQKAELEHKISSAEFSVQATKKEKTRLAGLVHRMKDVLLELHGKVQNFDLHVQAQLG